MKRRKLFQYAGWGSVGLVVGSRTQALALAPSEQLSQKNPPLKMVDFQVPTLDARGQLKTVQWHQATVFLESLNHQVELDMMAIAPGQFYMGAGRGEPHSKPHEYPQRSIAVQPFFMSKYPITQAQWAAVAQLPRVRRDLELTPSHFRGANHPVESVSWFDAVEFCDRLSRHTGRQYQLPSEAEWEYACRAGTQTPFHTGETITSQFANYVGTYSYQAEATGEYQKATVPVGRYAPNAFGLYDMHGNVWEWCRDPWHEKYQPIVHSNPSQIHAEAFQIRPIRGGSWSDKPAHIRASSRSGYAAASLNRIVGFRVACATIA